MYLALTIPASLCTTLSTTDASKQCWMFIYVPIVNGIPIEMEKENMRARYKHAVSTNEEYNASFSNPVVSFQIDDSGIDMWWDGPIDIQETLNENAVLLRLIRFRRLSGSSSLLNMRRKKASHRCMSPASNSTTCARALRIRRTAICCCPSGT